MSSATYPHIVNLLSSLTPKPRQVLEIGCGAMQYAICFPESQYTGIDLPTSEYIQRRPQRFRFVEGSATALPFESGQFDLVFGVAVFYLIRDVDLAFKEIYRTLASNGKLVVFDYSRRVLNRFPPHTREHVWTPQELKLRLIEAGFRSEKTDLSTEFDWCESKSLTDQVNRVFNRNSWTTVQAQK